MIVLRAARIVGHSEDVWARLRERAEAMPRTVNFITGPSKTGDVEQVIQEKIGLNRAKARVAADLSGRGGAEI